MAATAAAIAIPAIIAGLGAMSGAKSSQASRSQFRELTAPFGSKKIQKFLPWQLRDDQVNPTLDMGFAGIADLIRRPGSLSPTVSEAIAPRLAIESQNIAQNFRNIGSQQAGAASRGNVPVSIRTALQSALDVAQERAQRSSRMEALTQSDQLRREDLGKTFQILDAILGFLNSGRGIAGQAIQGAVNVRETNTAATLGMYGSLLNTLASSGVFNKQPAPAGGTP